MYKPNFCAECGGRIARLRWRVWTSRRFCEGCDKRFRRGRIVRPLVACVALAGAGFVAGRAMRSAPPPLVIERSASNSPPLASQLSTAGGERNATPAAGVTGATNDARAERYGADGTETERPTDPDEIVSICGARTKKGTPCSRRVRGTGRCWQHRGKPAMLPASKLIVRE
ncbi:MAG TPA: hypothetical protein VGX24_04140 [Pyrinomonadaceae bacterium]|nr:hypothetical protein [Pyrinomonadaceae bacterium]